MIEQLAQQLFRELSSKLSATEDKGSLSASTLKAIIEAKLRTLNLVTREEFDAQQAVLARTREKLESLEKEMALLTARLNREQTADKS